MTQMGALVPTDIVISVYALIYHRYLEIELSQKYDIVFFYHRFLGKDTFIAINT